jgi:hypothetical protein
MSEVSGYFISSSCHHKDHICDFDYDIPEKDNFGFNCEYIYDYIIVILALLTISIIVHKCMNKFTKIHSDLNKQFYITFIVIFSIGTALYIFIHSENADVCKYPRNCYEGINNTIITQDYYYQMNECPREYTWLTYYYSKINLYDEECNTSEWGCCTVNKGIKCSDFVDYTYSYYEAVSDDYDGHWTLNIAKLDEYGTNCPTIEEIIYEVSENDMNDMNNYKLYYVVTIIMYSVILVVINLCIYCNHKKYIPFESEDDTTIRASA